MVIIDTAVVPSTDHITRIREFYSNNPRVVQAHISGTVTATLYGRVDDSQDWLPIVAWTSSDMVAMFLPPQVYVGITGSTGTWHVTVSINITQTLE